MRKGEIDFTGELGILAALQPLDLIPQSSAFFQEGRRTGWQQNLRKGDAAASAVVVHLAGAFIPKLLAGTVGRGSDGRLSFGSADDLNREMVARHGGAMRRPAEAVNLFSNLSDDVAALRRYLCWRSQCISALLT
jgi:hypothetical protein